MQIYRESNVIHNIEIGEETVFTHKLMGEHIISTEFYTESPIDLQLGDYTVWNNEKYYINQVPNVDKINNFTYRYSFDFEGEVYFLLNKKLLHLGDFEFTFFGTPQEHLQLILDNVNTIVTGWQVGAVDDAEGKLLSYSNNNCKEALNLIASEFELEYKVVGRTISLQENVGTTTTYSFAYGRGNGLYSIKRSKVSDANVVTRMYGFGGSTNINTDYRDGAKKLTFEGGYLENNVALYGVVEGVFEDAEIFPQLTGTITAITADNKLEIFDTDLDFNINDQLMEGVTAQVVFKSGALGGNTFDIDNYNSITQKITLVANVDENDYTLPNDVVKAAVGDEYTIVGIKMPQTYIDAVEAELLVKTQESLDKNCVPQVIYEVTTDEKYFRQNAVTINAGDIFKITDVALGIDLDQRAAKIQYPLLHPKRITLTIADFVPFNVQDATRADLKDNKVYTRNIDKRSIENTRKMAINQRNLKNQIFDTGGYFDTDRIKPLSIDTSHLSVGQKSQDFNLLNVSIQTNITNANDLQISAGQLVHNAIEISLGYIWELPQLNISTLVSASSYYVYAKCSKNSLTGTWHVSNQQKEVESESGYYLFLLGVLYPEQDDKRDFYFTKGMTYIVGDTIKTGRIQSTDGLTFIDLDTGSYRIGNGTSYLDWNNEETGVLNVKNAKITNATIQNSNVENLTVSNGSSLGDWKIVGGVIASDNTNTPAIALDAGDKKIILRDGSIELKTINGDIYSRINGSGIAIETEGEDFRTPSSQLSNDADWKAGMASILHHENSSTNSGDLYAAVYGKATADNNSARTFGGYFVRLMARGFFQKYEVNSLSNYYMWSTKNSSTRDNTVVVNTYNGASIYLPNVSEADRGCVVSVMSKKGVSAAVKPQGSLTVDYDRSQYTVSSYKCLTVMYIHEESTWAILNEYDR